jgi:hypothetical protein
LVVGFCLVKVVCHGTVLGTRVVQVPDLKAENCYYEEVPWFRSRVRVYQNGLLSKASSLAVEIPCHCLLPLRHSTGRWLEQSPLLELLCVVVDRDWTLGPEPLIASVFWDSKTKQLKM